jgi:DNA-directed RNA polymerase subunit RPC12/RpoP
MMNNDLISRSALLENYGLKDAVKYDNKTEEQQHNSYSTLMLYEIADMIMDAPAVDAEPVRHGRWEDTHEYDPFTGIYKCSECGLFTTMTTGSLVDGKKDNYCPNCGAKMDAEVE